MTTKICNKCGETFPLSGFNTHPTNRDRLSHTCKGCYNADLAVKHALRRGFESLKPAACECCGKVTDKLTIDHDHNTKMFRGYMCPSCNKSLSWLGDTYEGAVAKKADQMFIDYLKRAEWRMGKTFHALGKYSGR
tara:strand:- start:2 stop:406 length:405 start_codon:yes stop_codon:yes gene_type:complete